MRLTHPSGLLLALLAFLLFFIGACSGTPQEDALSTEQPLPSPKAQVISSPTSQSAAQVTPSVTPLPLVVFQGVEFFFDEDRLGKLGELAHVPPSPPGKKEARPERLEFALGAAEDAPYLTVFPVSQYEALSEEAARHTALLRKILAEKPSAFAADLPFLPMIRSVQSFHTDPVYLRFQNGEGISYLVRADHDHSLATDEGFFYTFQGLTDDGQFYITTIIPLTDVTVEESDTAAAETAQESSGTQAQMSGGVWLGAADDGQSSIIETIIQSLRVEPGNGFPEVTLPDFASTEGLVVAYDEKISGAPTLSHKPVVVSSPQGAFELLEQVPYLLVAEFGDQESGMANAVLEIQPLRDEQGDFYQMIPQWQKDEADALVGNLATASRFIRAPVVDELQAISFLNGAGIRWLEPDSEAQAVAATGPTSEEPAGVYQFSGVSNDGRFLVRFRHHLQPSLPQDEMTTYLDRVVKSIVIDHQVSGSPPAPLNNLDCTNDAVFVADGAIANDTVIERGDEFFKEWRVRNTGTCSWTPAYQLSFSEGNPLMWEPMSITKIIAPGEEVALRVSVESPEVPAIYQAWWRLADSQGDLFGESLMLRFETPRPATDIPGHGVIEGNIHYPANGNPGIDIYFLRTDGSESIVMQTEKGWTHFSRVVPVGEYYVFARVTGDGSDSGGGYTVAVTCGLHATCQDHTLLPVVVDEGRATRDVNISDWYAPAGSFPLPAPIVPRDTPTPDTEISP